MSIQNTAIDVAGLCKSYADNDVLRSVDFTVQAGTVYALMGPNGAGKTTMVRVLTTLTSADAGEVRVAGADVRHDPDSVRRAIGVTGQFSAIDELLTGRENLLLMADLGHLRAGDSTRRVDELVERFDLTAAAGRRAATYSGGMKRRLDLAMTLMCRPQLIFLDEPTTGLDPRSRRELWQIVRELVSEGVTIFLTTQYLDEADELADLVGVLDGGRLVAEGTPADLKRRVTGGQVEISFTSAQAMAAARAAFPGAAAHEEALTLDVPYDGQFRSLRQLMGQLDDEAVSGVEVRTPDLDDVFLALTGHSARASDDATPALEVPR